MHMTSNAEIAALFIPTWRGSCIRWCWKMHCSAEQGVHCYITFAHLHKPLYCSARQIESSSLTHWVCQAGQFLGTSPLNDTNIKLGNMVLGIGYMELLIIAGGGVYLIGEAFGVPACRSPCCWTLRISDDDSLSGSDRH